MQHNVLCELLITTSSLTCGFNGARGIKQQHHLMIVLRD